MRQQSTKHKNHAKLTKITQNLRKLRHRSRTAEHKSDRTPPNQFQEFNQNKRKTPNRLFFLSASLSAPVLINYGRLNPERGTDQRRSQPNPPISQIELTCRESVILSGCSSSVK